MRPNREKEREADNGILISDLVPNKDNCGVCVRERERERERMKLFWWLQIRDVSMVMFRGI